MLSCQTFQGEDQLMISTDVQKAFVEVKSSFHISRIWGTLNHLTIE